MTGGLNQSQLAQALKVSRTMVTNYKKQGKITPDENGLYDLEATKQELARNLRPRKDGRPGVVSRQASEDDPANEGLLTNEIIDGTTSEGQRRQIWLKVQKEALELRSRKGELLDRDSVVRAVGAMIAMVKTRLRAVGSKVAPEVEMQSAATVEAAINQEIDEALAALKQWEPPVAV